MTRSHDTPSATSWTTVATEDGDMDLFVAGEAGAGRAVVVLQEAFGVNDHIQDVTRRIAAQGYLACAPDLFHRTGTGTLDYDQHAEAMPLIGAIDPDQILIDVRGVLDHLRKVSIDVDRVVIIGFCFGGRAAFTAATGIPGLAGTVVFYGPGVAAGPHAVLDRAAGIDAPMMVHVGAGDPTIPAAHVEATEAALASSPAPTRQYVYEGAGHAFACDARPSMYDESAAGLAWARTYEFLVERLPAQT